MRPSLVKPIVAVVVVLVVIGLGIFGAVTYINKHKQPIPVEQPQTNEPIHKIIGQSVEGRNLESFTFGKGDKHLLFVGGIHGGYEWNSVLLAYQFIDYVQSHPEIIPGNVSVTIIPSANPDGVYKVIGKEGKFTALDIPANEDTSGAGRFNAHGVDLNRNFDCKWKPESTWRSKTVSAGTAAFSEPEAQALRNFILEDKPVSVVFWHSQANAVYASECLNGILPETRDIMTAYSSAAGYKAVDVFDSYEVTGDAEGWLASINIPAITVELSTHGTIEWDKNIAGVQALLNYYGYGKK